MYRNAAKVCGDDLIAIWPKVVIKRYHQVMSRCGVQISASKHFIEEGSGVFLEETFKLSMDKYGRI
jgi:hypothetical protein